ncbi:MAG: hypothetical protein NTZ80_00870 [Patescibacteria group bacterium]|nr:hypothetical protein [Patescibacteria group bacterium]
MDIFTIISRIAETIIAIVIITSPLWGWIAKKWIEDRIRISAEKGLEKYKSELGNKSSKNIQLWLHQKDLMLNFVDFLEKKVFFNKDLDTSKPDYAEKCQKINDEMNLFYGKLYLLLDTNILRQINKLITGAVTDVQRYYFYKEIRIHLLKLLYPEITDFDKECPYVEVEVDKPFLMQGEKRAKTFDELKEVFPFIEQGEPSMNNKETYKALALFASSN